MPRAHTLRLSRSGLITARRDTAFVRAGPGGSGVGNIVGAPFTADNRLIKTNWSSSVDNEIQEETNVIIDDSGNVTLVGLTMTGALATPTSLTMGGAISGATNIGLSGNLDIGAAGVRLSASNGTLTMLGLGDGFDENVTFDLNTTENTVIIGSTSGAGSLDLSAFATITSGTILTLNGIIGGDNTLDIIGLEVSGGIGGGVIITGGRSTSGGSGGPVGLRGGTALGAGLAGGAATITGGIPGSGGTWGSIIFAGNSEDLVLDFISNTLIYTSTTGLNKLLYTSIDQEIRGAVASNGVLTLSTAETTNVDGDRLGQIDFQAPLDAAGTDAILVAASIHAEADDTFAADNNATSLVFSTALSETAAEKMRLNSTGLGIGLSNPLARCHVDSNTAWTVSSTQSGQDTLFLTDNSQGSGNGFQGASIGFAGPGNDSRRCSIVAWQGATDADHVGLKFYTHPSNTGSADLVEQLWFRGFATYFNLPRNDVDHFFYGADDLLLTLIGQTAAQTVTINSESTANVDFAVNWNSGVALSILGSDGIVLVGRKIGLIGDTDTFMDLTTDKWALDTGGEEMIACDSVSAQSAVTINGGLIDVDTVINGDTAAVITVRASDDALGLYAVTPVVRSPGWVITSDMTDRNFDAENNSVEELYDLFATLVRDIAATGLIGAVTAS